MVEVRGNGLVWSGESRNVTRRCGEMPGCCGAWHTGKILCSFFLWVLSVCVLNFDAEATETIAAACSDATEVAGLSNEVDDVIAIHFVVTGVVDCKFA